MHEPAGVVEILVQILQFTVYPYYDRTPPPMNVLTAQNALTDWQIPFVVFCHFHKILRLEGNLRNH